MQLTNICVADQVAEGAPNSKNQGSDLTHCVNWEMNSAETSTLYPGWMWAVGNKTLLLK